MSFYTFVAPLASTLMAPGLPEIATMYGITNATVVALTLSIFLLAYALSVGIMYFYSSLYWPVWISPLFSPLSPKCMDELGWTPFWPITFTFLYSYYALDPSYQQSLDNGSQFGMCICANDRRPNSLPFSLYVNIPRHFPPNYNTWTQLVYRGVHP